MWVTDKDVGEYEIRVLFYCNARNGKQELVMVTFFITFSFFLIICAAMAVGYIFQKKSISGSCGGLGALGIDKACDCPEPCDKRRRRMAKEAAWKENQII
jgi:hypothetical protein